MRFLTSTGVRRQRGTPRHRRCCRPGLELLEDRNLLSTGADGSFQAVMLTNLRADPTYAGITGSGIGIADIDSGIYAANPDLQPNVKAWYDAVANNNPSTDPAGSLANAFDPVGHGSHTAGIAASSNPNIGVAYHANIIAVRGLAGPNEAQPNHDTVLTAMQWVYANADQYNIKVVNMSLGINGTNVNGVPAITDSEGQEIQALEARGITVVLSSGNDYADFGATGVSEHSEYGTFTVANTWAENIQFSQPVISGGGLNSKYFAVETEGAVDQLNSTSQRSQLSSQVAAPGSNIYSTWNGTTSGLPGDPNHNIDSGTSMAAPLVSGMVALMQQAAQQFGGRYLSPQEIQNIVVSTADTITDANNPNNGRDPVQNAHITGPEINLPETGLTYKRVNIYHAIQMVRQVVSQNSGGGSGDTNNTKTTAVNVGNLDGTIQYTASGTIGTDGQVQTGANDVDLFKLTVTSQGSIQVRSGGFLGSTGDYPLLRIFDSSGNEIASSYVASPPTDYQGVNTNTLSPGTYYLGVSGYNNLNYNITTGAGAANGLGTGTYQLSIALSNPDPNGVIPGAVPYSGLPKSYPGNIGSDPPPVNSTTRVQVGSGDVDMFQVIAPDDGDLTIDVNTTGLTSPLTSAIRVFDDQGNQLAFQDSGGQADNTFKLLNLQIGHTYYVAVSDDANVNYSPFNPYGRSTAGQGGNYNLSLTFDNHDQNGTAQTAVPETVGTPVNSAIGTDPNPSDPTGPRITVGHDGSKDVDFLLYQAPSAGYLDVTATGNSGFIPSLSLWELNANQTDIIKVAATTRTSSEIIQPVTAGQYVWVAVTGLGNDNFLWFAPASGSGGMTGTCTVNVSMRPSSDATVLTDNQVLSGGQPATGVQDIALNTPIAGNIGMDGNVAVGDADVDLYRFVAPATQTLFIQTDTSAEGSASTFLRFFDSAGNELKYSGDSDPTDTNNFLSVQVVAGQTYYLGVDGSGPGARSYNPLDGSGATASPNTTGNYSLTITPAATISGQVFEDVNGNGVQDAGDTALPGVTVQLLDPASGNVLATQASDASGNYSFTGLHAGTYRVRALTPSGQVQKTADPADFAVNGNAVGGVNFGEADAIAPTVAITSGPAGASVNTTATFTFTGSDNVTPAGNLVFQVSLDGAAFTNAASPVTYTQLNLGSHTFQVRDIDQAGNVSAVASSPFTIADAIPPTVAITGGPAGASYNITATFTFSGNDNVTPAGNLVFQVSLDGAPFANAASPVTYTRLNPGSHTFQVRDIDQAGNVSAVASSPFTILAPNRASGIGVFDPTSGNWYLRYTDSPGAPNVRPFAYGAPSWTPIIGDWNADGTATIGVVDPTTMTWYLRNSLSPGAPDIPPFAYGAPGWIPLSGHWSGRGQDTPAVFDPTTATFYIAVPGRVLQFAFGVPGWIPVIGDWNGDGTSKVGVFDPATGTWHLAVPGGVLSFAYGGPGWQPVVGDWNNDGITTIGVVDPAGRWYLRNSNTPGGPDVAPFAYGAGGWRPLSGDFNGPDAERSAEGEGPGAAALTAADLSSTVAAALARLAADGVSSALLNRFAAAQIQIAHLGNGTLGLAYVAENRIVLDDDAAGHGWFVDPTPLADEEFSAGADGALHALTGGPAADRVDLLTVVLHEFGHLAGTGDDSGSDDADLMAGLLPVGVRRTDALDAVFGGHS